MPSLTEPAPTHRVRVDMTNPDPVLDRLTRAGITLPEPPPPGGAYQPTVEANGLLYVSAQFPITSGKPAVTGRLGETLHSDQGYAAARLAAINVLAQVYAALGGFTRIRTLLRLDGHLLTTPDFQHHARVMDGASDLFNAALGDRAGHTRALTGVASLPMDLPVELVTTFAVSETA
jgi:enamine deaminase RidA (YjgF/YER057c/UK114 family)